MSDRSITGFLLYQRGNVNVTFEDEEYLMFDVKSKKTVYPVEYEKSEGSWRCLCPDYLGRHLKAPGSFTCKHIMASVFKLAELKGVNKQADLRDVLGDKLVKS